MNIIEAIKDENLLKPFLSQGKGLGSWAPWLTAMRCLYGLPINSSRGRKLVKQCTGRMASSLPSEGFDTALFLTGRRSGKSRGLAAPVAAYEACLSGRHKLLNEGEIGLVPIISPTTAQSRIVKSYLRSIFEIPMLKNEVVDEQRGGFTLRNGVRIEILAGDFRSVRGYTLLAVVVDEVAFFGLEAEAKVKSDTELIRAIQPSLATTNGKLIAISSPYAQRGWCWNSFQKHHGREDSGTLVWNCPSRTMNPTLSQKIIDRAYNEDYASAKAEYGGEFRDDVGILVPETLLRKHTVAGRSELLPRPGTKYQAFCDLSGARVDDFTLSIAHNDSGVCIVDLCRRWKPPFAPSEAVAEMAKQLQKYNCRKVIGDRYAGEWPVEAFSKHGIRYEASEKNKSELYLEFLAMLCSSKVELPDDPLLIKQLASLERRTRSGGRDVVDHPPGCHDDLANAVSGVVQVTLKRRLVIGALK